MGDRSDGVVAILAPKNLGFFGVDLIQSKPASKGEEGEKVRESRVCLVR